jgi:F-type H+-transporting ATPase subunit b
MLIDWFTVIAQVINFLILVWLLKRFLYRPILNAIDARERQIATKLADAEAKKTEAQKEQNEFLQKNEEFDKQSSARMSQVLDEAKAERQRLLDTARLESDDLRAKLQQALRTEQQNLKETLTRRAREEVFAIARKALTDLAGTTLEERMTDIFLRRLRELNDTQMAGLKSAFNATTGPLLVRTAFKLPSEQCAAIEAAIKQTLGKDKNVQFDTVPDLVSGIEMSANGQKIAWSIAEYLTSLGKSVEDLLKTPTVAQANPEANNKSSNEQGAK